MEQVLPVIAKTVLGVALVVAFAVLAQTLQQKLFAGVFAAAPSVALATLIATVISFLAFPAILLASLTLVAKEDGAARAREDARGATFGGLGLIAFGLLGSIGFGSLASPVVFVVCTAGWAVVAVGAFLLAWGLGAGADEPT